METLRRNQAGLQIVSMALADVDEARFNHHTLDRSRALA